MANKRSNRKRRPYKKKKYNAKVLVNKGISYLPDTYCTKLKFQDRVAIVCTSGAANYAHYGLNCLYDPYLGVGGGQPNGFDQLMTLYAKYRVYASKYQVYCTTTGSGSGANNLEVACAPTADTSLSTADPQDVGQQPRGVLKFSYPGAPPAILTKYVSTAQIFGVTNNAFAIEDSYAGSVSSNPSNVSHLWICIQPVDESSTTTGYIYTRITYYCMFTNRITQDDA